MKKNTAKNAGNNPTPKQVASASPVPMPTYPKPTGEMSFIEAMTALVKGKSIRRVEWADQEERCLLHDDFISIYRNGKFHAWIISEGDALAGDWVALP